VSAAELLTPEAIRERCGRIFEAGRAGKLEHFAIDEAALEGVADRVAATTKQRYPDLAIPYHGRLGHLRVGGVDRPSRAIDPSLSTDEHGRRLFELVITSVLLDAGAGMAWRFVEDGVTYARSEGLAVASAHLFSKGAFSSKDDATVDARSSAWKVAQSCFAASAARCARVPTSSAPTVGSEASSTSYARRRRRTRSPRARS
jgi:hypothetical protein